MGWVYFYIIVGEGLYARREEDRITRIIPQINHNKIKTKIPKTPRLPPKRSLPHRHPDIRLHKILNLDANPQDRTARADSPRSVTRERAAETEYY